MNEIQALPVFLMNALLQDPALALAEVTAWLDPIHFYPEEVTEDYPFHDDYHDDDESALAFALSIARRCFPEVYAGTIRYVRQGCTFSQAADFYSTALNRLYPHISLWSFQDMMYGIPCEWSGLEPLSPDFLAHHPDLVVILGDFFGIEPQEHESYWSSSTTYHFDETDFELAYRVSIPLTRSLIKEMSQPYADLAFLLMWLFSASGNSLVDHSLDSYYDNGFQPLEWEPELLEMVNEAHRQAEVILSAAERGIVVLQTDTELADAFRRNVNRVRRALEKEARHVSIDWPERTGRVAESDPGGTGPDAALSELRDCFAQED